MKNRSFPQGLAILLTVLLTLAVAPAARAEVKEVRIAKQYGLGYLPLIILEEQKLIEKHARATGLGEVKVTWATVGGGSAAADALLSDSVDYISSGVAPLVLLWAKSQGEVKGVSALNGSPMFLNSTNPAVKTIRDLTAQDRIALPSVKISIQAVLLQIAAAKEFGNGNYAKLDPLTVSMKHPDALAALLSGHTEINAHLTGPPYTYKELRDPKVHKVLDSYDVFDGPHTFLVFSSTRRFQKKNPKTFAAVFAALEEAVTYIKADHERAADAYIRVTGSKESREFILEQLNDPAIFFDTTPLQVSKFAEFMHETGTIKKEFASWRDLFFETVSGRQGS